MRTDRIARATPSGDDRCVAQRGRTCNKLCDVLPSCGSLLPHASGGREAVIVHCRRQAGVRVHRRRRQVQRREGTARSVRMAVVEARGTSSTDFLRLLCKHAYE